MSPLGGEKLLPAETRELDHGAEHKPYGEQLNALSETMPDLFTTGAEEKPNTPQFIGGTGGTMPKGNEVPSFGSLWGFAPTK